MATYYIDNNRGSDSNNGTSPSTPWKNLAKIPAVTGATAGDAFLLADDSTWRLTMAERVTPPSTWTGKQHNPIIIGKYSPSSQSIGQKPTIICHNNTVRGDWTYDAPMNGWKYTYPTSHINKTLLVRIADSWLANSTDQPKDEAVASVDGRFNTSSDSRSLWLYAPAGINPIDYYGKVVIAPQAHGAITLASDRGWITVQDLHFQDVGCGVLLYSETANEVGFVAQRISGRVSSGLITVGSGTIGNLRAWVLDCDIRDFGAIGIHVNSSGGAGMQYVEVARNRIDDGIHIMAQGGIYLQGRNPSRDFIIFVHHNEISNCRWGTKDKTLDGCGIYAETGSDGAMIYGNVVHDCYVAMQDNSGRRNIWSGNVIYNCRRGIRITDEMLNGQMDHISYNNTFFVGDLNQNASNFGNTVQGADYPAYWMYRPTGTFKVTTKNNLIVKSGGQRGRAAFGLPASGGTFNLSGNWLYGFETDALNASDNSSSGLSLTHAGASDPSPYLNTDYSLKTTISVGGIPMPNPLRNAGTYVQGVALRNGRTQPGMTPIGAYQVGRY